MVSRSVVASFLVSSPFLLSSVAALVTTCYVVDGDANSNAGFRCDNSTTGHSACCAAGATCYSNGLCKQDNGDIVDYLRVGCTDPTGTLQHANSSSAGVRWCGSDITETTSYCCDDGSTGAGSFACCNTQSDIFQISPAATVLAQMPLSQLTTTTTSATTSATSSASTTTSAAATTSASSPGGGSSNGAAIGAGISVPVGLLALAGIGYFWRRRRNPKQTQTYELQNGTEGPYSGGYGGAVGAGGEHQETSYHDHMSPPPISEADSAVPYTPGMGVGGKKGYLGGQQYESAPLQPTELPNTQAHVVHEMEA
ncbi:hypothetical protein BDZ45DRAFT_796608 [Acephala macrosclerotiorum]|nr:hypothetical protein BDZ45DRAFT_796608 [Acephala macrosclerotiorum]